MKLRRSLISLLLVFCMFVQTIIPVFADGTNSTENSESISSAREKFNEAYEKIMAIEEVKLEDCAKTVIQGKDLADNAWYWYTSMPSEISDQMPAQFVDHTREIEEANQNIRDSQETMREMKAKLDSGSIDNAEIAAAHEFLKFDECKIGFDARRITIHQQADSACGCEAGDLGISEAVFVAEFNDFIPCFLRAM